MRTIVIAMLCLLSASPAFAACAGRSIARHVYRAPVCIPAEPKRIVVLDPFLSLGVLWELEAPFIGAPLMGIQDEPLRVAVARAAVVDLGHPMQPSLEQVAALQPDLIIGASYMHAQAYEMTSRIAPTLLIDPIDWKEQFRLIAEVTGRSEKAEAALRAYEERAAAIRKRVPDIEVSVVRVASSGFQVYLDGPAAYAPYGVLREAGVKRTAYETTTDGTVVKRPDWEGIAALDGTVLLYVVVSGYEAAPDNALERETLANPLWQMLPAVAAGRSHRVERATWMGFYGVTSAHKVLDDIERYILPAQ